jgi:TonB-dependent receptor
MRILFTITILLLFLVSINHETKSQSVEAVITGRILDGDNGEPLIGASVIINEKKTGVASSINGNFVLRVFQDEEITIAISFIGFETKQIDVKVDKAEIDLGNISLNADVTSLEVITVRASLEGQQKALNQQRTADNIKNVISADLIGRFPDLNVAEALQRVPGININRDKGEGSEVTVRGTPAHYTTIQINGEQIPSVQQGGSRNEALDLIPADQLATMEITKAPTPDMDGDAIGGVVNLRTPTARKPELNLKVESALGFNDISGGLNGIGKFKVDKRFFSNNKVREGRLGVMASASYYSTDNSEDRIDADWQGQKRPIENLDGADTVVLANYQFRKTENQRERIGATFSLDYKFDDKNQIVFNYMYNRREDNDLRNRLRFDTDRSGTTWESLDSIRNARIRRDINFWDEVKTNQSFSLQGYHTLSNWQIDWALFQTVSNRTFSSDRGDFSRDELDLVVDNPNGIYTDFPNFRAMDPSLNIHNPLLLNDFRRYEEDAETTDATNTVARFDMTRFFKLAGYDSYIKFGSKARVQTNSKSRDNVVFAINDPNNVLRANEAFLRVVADTEPDDFLFRNYRFGPKVGRAAFNNYISDNRLFFVTADNAWDSERLSLSDTYDAFENIYSAYAMGRFQIDNLMVLGGLRYEFNDVGYDAFEVIRQGTTVSGTPIQGGTDYGFLLPNVHLKYSIDRFTALRFSTVFNYARPNFVDIVPFVNFDADAVRLSLGNPELQPADALNIDAMFERYFSNVGVISVGAFYKNINQFQFSRIDPSLQEDFPGYPSTQGFEFRQEQNGENAIVAGVEVNFVRALDFLPGFLSNLNLNGNYTYAYSDAFTQDRDNISLPGQAAHTANGAISFDYGEFSGRVSLNYNGSFVNSLASQRQDDIIQAQRLQLDLNASYNISQNWRVYGEVVNLTNAPTIRYQGIEERISQIGYFGWWSRLGISYRL